MNWRRLFGWAATLLYTVFLGNVVLAKLGSLTATKLPLLGDRQEFLLLLLATAAFIGFALCDEARNNIDAATAGAETTDTHRAE